MASDVQIVMSVIDKASAALKGIGGSFTELLSALRLVQQGAKVVSDVFNETVGVSVEYNKQIREMTQVTGLGAEEISRIVQVADDWGISVDAVRTSLAFMNKQGIKPSIENLAKMADEYVNSADKSEWAKKAVKDLGRGYQTLIPLFAKGGDALREQTKAIDKNLIATEASIQAARDYEIATDNLSDALLAQKIAIGNELLPVITSMLTPAVNEEINGQTYLVKQVGDTTQAFIRKGQVLEDVTSKYLTLKAQQEGVNFQMDQGARVALEYKKDLYDLSGALDETETAADEAAKELESMVVAIEKIDRARLAKEALDAVNQEFLKTGDQDAYESNLLAIGQLFSDVIPAGQVEASIALAHLKKDYQDGETELGGYIIELDRFGRTVLTLPKNVKIDYSDVKDAIDALHDLERNMDDETKNIYVNTIYTTTGNPRQHGGPVQSNTPYIVGEAGPELFIPPTSGKIIPNNQLRSGGGGAAYGGDIYANFVINAAQGQSTRAIAREVLNMLGEAQRYASAGGGYQGV